MVELAFSKVQKYKKNNPANLSFFCLFPQVGKITGAKIYVFLLEHSRVSLAGMPQPDKQEQQSESSFHSFNYVMAGLGHEGLLKGYFPANEFPSQYFPRIKVDIIKQKMAGKIQNL